MYKYVLFDLDGTLTDPKEGICKSVQYALHKMNIEEPDIDKLEPFIGPSLKYSFTTFYNMSEEDALKAVEYYRERFSVVGLYENIPYEGIDKVLSNLKLNGAKLAVASAKPQVFVEKIMDHFDLAKYFDAIVGSELDGTRSEKPEIITEALLQMFYGKEHEETELAMDSDYMKHTVMVGDRFYDVEGAKALGIDSIAVEYGYAPKGELKKSGATYMVKTVAALDKLLAEKAGRGEGPSDSSKDKTKKKELQPEKSGKQSSFFKAVHVLVPFVLYYLVMMATVSVCTILYGELQKSSSEGVVRFISENSWVFTGGVTGLSTLAAGIVMILTYRKTDTVHMRLHTDMFFSGLAGIFFAVGLNMLFIYILRAFPALADSGKQTSTAELPVIFGILFYIIISPAAEEILFRYLIYGRVKKWMGPGIAIFSSALFFGLYHAVVLQSIYAFMMGLAMAILYEWTDNFFMPLIFHIMANAVVYSLRFVPFELTAFSMGPFICGFSILLGIAMLLTVYKNNIKTSLV